MSMSGLEEVFSLQKSGGAFPCTMYYDQSTNINKYIKIYGTNTFKHTGVLNVGGTYDIPFNGVQKAAIVHLAACSKDGSISEGGVWLVTATSVTLLAGTANTAIGEAAGKLCVAHGTGVRVINNLTTTVTYVISTDWTT